MINMYNSGLSIVRYLAKSNIIVQGRYASQALPQLSSEKYDVKRKNFGTVQAADINYFKSILSEQRVVTDESDVLPFNIDWIKNCRGQSKVVLKPKTTEEVSKILAYCNEKRLAVCPQGGNTGLVGGSVPVFDEIVLSFMLMNKIISLDEISGALVCEAGCILENVDNYVRNHNLIMPLDLGAKGTCHVGGNVSTNAGGLRLLRYGNLHGSLLGIEAVKADGTVIDCLRSLKKDNTGYHLKHLFVGSEGTLGIVTKLAIHCPVLPKAVTLGFFGVENFDNVLKLYRSAKASLGEILSAFEMADREAITSTSKNLKLPNPLSEYPFYVLLETHGSDEEHDADKLNRFLNKEMDSGLILDGTVTSEPAKMQTIWNLRESIAGAGLLDGYIFKYDVSIPIVKYYDLVPLLRQRLGSKATRVYGYGHIGDGNIHINVTVPEYNKEVSSLLEPFIFEEVSKLQGSVSAEHGIGFRKPQYIHYSKDRSALGLMRDLKTLMDPNGILNPYKVLPDDV
ncbi:D-2-hydroxyglutarate dehydrogenase, mitochondrial isoform X1 [Pectinophora gossypiella]|uniref:D-2-hydroxyglutarate dehydrogenase, mitochondrial isoform X1 n=1 Tax=Pectinophora gossypiella TaxID=13191 RepID=UPI00214F1F32|nr:D-2-hydroxyglutarate dehydrogenase, mitochondrial isoform X1 [Pectinophora gossypiella]